MGVLLFFVYLVSFVFCILSIILFFKIWEMTNNVTSMLSEIKSIRACISNAQTNVKETTHADFLDVSEKSDLDNNVAENGGLAVGQLVIIKNDERQFRISSIQVENGIKKYYSEKFNTSFSEDEIQDFDEYWKIKKGI